MGVGLSSGAALLLARNATQGPILRKTRVTIIATWQTKDRVVYRLRVRSPRAAMSVGAFLRLETPRGLSRPLFWANSSGQGEATMITVVFTRLLGQAAAAGRLFLIDTKGGYQTLQPEG
ncbi:MAG: hypothetical protein CSA65_01860 [Proteobacteria bacterium]|nr:MAG: hypothetical protein CSA65_01860 [Pseudomonadota bacterium]